ncbi:MAG: hypothetical protein IKB06_04335 [Clostridia bacterium]|nr:hypothetical protein [Clostridia bacterium]
MRKMRNSVKAIIIAICTVVVAVSATLGIILLNKNKGKNPASEYALTQAQKNLVAEINQKALKEQAKNQNNLQVFDSMIFRDENGTAVDTSTVAAFNDQSFVVQTGEEVFSAYVYSEVNNVMKTTELISYLKEKDMIDDKYTSIEYDKRYQSQIKDQYYMILKATYTVDEDDKFDLIVVDLGDQKDVSILNVLPWNGFSAFNFGFGENYYIYNYIYRESTGEDILESDVATMYSDITFIDYTSGNSKNVRLYVSENGGLGMNSFLNYYSVIPYKTKYTFVTHDKLTNNFNSFDYSVDESFSYEFSGYDAGLLLEKADEYSEDVDYLFVNPYSKKSFELKFDKNYSYSTVYNVSQKYFCVLSMKDENNYKFDYYSNDGTKVISYYSQYEDDYILYGKKNNILTTHAIISTKSSVSANVVSNFGNDEESFVFETEFYPSDYFVVSQEGMNICDVRGELVYDDSFDYIHQYKGIYIASYEEKYYFLDPLNKTKTEIVNFSSISSQDIDDGLNLLKFGLYVVENNGVFTFLDFEKNLVVFETKFGDRSQFTSLNFVKDEGSGFFFIEATSTNNEIIILTVYDVKDYVFNAPETYSHAVSYASRSTSGAYRSKYTFSATHDHWLADDTGSGYVNVTNDSEKAYISYNGVNRVKGIFGSDGGNSCSYSSSYKLTGGNFEVTISDFKVYCYWLDFKWRSISPSISSAGSEVRIWTKVNGRKLSGGPYTWKPSSVSYAAGTDKTLYKEESSKDNTSGSITGATRKGSYFSTSSSSTTLYETDSGDVGINTYLKNGSVFGVHYYRYPAFKENEYTLKFDFTSKYNTSGVGLTTTASMYDGNTKLTSSSSGGSFKVAYTKTLSAAGVSFKSPTLSGYEFKGWYVNGSKISGSSSKLAATGTVTAKAYFAPADIDVHFNYVAGNQVTSSDNNYNVYIKKRFTAIGEVTSYKYNNANITTTYLKVGSTYLYNADLFYDSDYYIWGISKTNYLKKTTMVIDPETSNITGSKSWSGSEYRYFTDDGTYIISTESKSIKGDEGLKATTPSGSIPSSNKWYESFEVSYDPAKLLTKLFEGANTNNFTKTCKPNLITITGQGLQFKSWLVEVNPSSGSNYLISVDNSSLNAEATSTMFMYLFGGDKDSSGNYPKSVVNGSKEIRVYALYEERDYVVKTDDSNVVYGSSALNTADSGDTPDDKLKDYTTVINNVRTDSKISILHTPINAKFTDTVNVSIYLNGETASVSDKEAYYVFDKVEIKNYGYRVWVSKSSSSSDFKYVYGYCTIRFTLSALSPRTWSVEFINETPAVLNNMTHYYNSGGTKTSFGTTNNAEKFQKLVQKSASFGTNSTYYVRDGHGTQFNTVKISSATATSLVFSVSNCGVTGTYASNGSFSLNETTAKSGTGGFKVVAYPKSNYLAKDTISINTGSSTGIGSVLGLAIQPLTSITATELVFWIDNVKYTTNGVASGFYRLDDKSSGKINKTTTYNFENSAVKSGNTITNYLDIVYVYKNPSSAKASESYVYYPSYLVKSAYPATGTTITSSTVRNWASDIAAGETSASVMKNFNYENMRMFVVKPEQTLINTSLRPSNKVQSSTAYELTSYLSTIVIDSTTSITLKAEKDAISGNVNSNSTYVYDVLRMKSNNKDEEMYPQPSATPAVNFDNSGKISYCGIDYVIQSAFKKTINTNSKVSGSKRTVWVYLVKNSTSGEYFYFIYADVDGTKTGTSNAVSFQFTFKQFDKTLSITVDDQSDLYDADNHNSLSYRVVSSANELTLASSGNEYGTKKTYSFGSEYYYKSYGDLTNSTLLKKASYTFNPSSFMILEFVPTSGYLISDFKVKLHNSELGTDLFSLSLKNLEPTINNGDFYYTTTFGSGAEQNFKPSILYTHSGKMFNAYNYNSTYNGIYCTQNYNDNWVQYFTSDPFKMEHIYVIIAGAYDNVSITAKTVSYSELVFEDNDGGNNLAYKADSSTKINDADANYLEGNIYSVASLQNLDILLCDDGTWFKLGSGTKNGSKDAYVVKSGNYYRVILLGKAQYLRSGVKIFASSDNYSYYLTDGRFYNDYDSTDSALDAFNMLRKTGATFTGRTNDGKSLYNSGNSANTSLVDVESAASLNFTQTTLANNAKITYLFINDLLKSHSLNEWKTTSQSGAAASAYTSRILGSYSSETASKEYERSNKLVMVFSIRKNEVKFTTNSYLYNNTITQNYGTIAGGLIDDVDSWVSGFEATDTYSSSLVAKLYNDSDNYRLWRYSGGEIAGYQLDYVGKLYDSSGNVIKDASNNDYIYKKESSWFNDTILTNIDYDYYADATTPQKHQNWQSVAGNYGKHSNVVSGYNIKYTYYNIPGYYLQFLEIVTVDFGSIYVPVSAISAATQQRIVYSNKSIGITIEVTFDDGVYTILLYDDGTGLTAPINSLGILNNNFTINFYSKSYEYAVYLNANTGESSTSADVVAWNNTGDNNYSFTSKGGYSKVISNYTSVFYDSLNYIGAYLEMPGYTFVGWGSEKYNSSSNRYNAATNTWNSSSLWLPIHSYFAAGSRSNLTNNFGEKSYGYDFYVKASASSAYNRALTTGYFITDTGFSDTENYNFWSVYAESFMATLGSRKPSSTIPILTYLHGIWKANVYTLTFEVNDTKSTVSNGSTIHALEINSGEYGLNDPKEYFFDDEFIIGNLGFHQNGINTTTYYCYVTFDDNDWFITESSVNASQMTSYDDYYAVENTSSGYGNSYSNQGKFAIAGSSQSNLLNVIIDRYGYSWLGWFTKVKPNANVSSNSNTVTEWMVFNSEYYNANTKGTIRKELPVLGKGKSCNATTFNISAKPDVKSGWLDANASCIDYRWFTNINEPYSDFVYVGEDKLNTSILKTRSAVIDGGNAGSKYLIAFYNYKHERKQFSLTVGDPYGYSAIDFLNDKTGSSKKASRANLAGGSSTVANTYITYFDTSLTYDCYSIANNTSNYATVKVVRDNSVITKLKTIMLYANWETNRYDIVIEWRDDETIKDDYSLGSTEAGILQGDGSIHKDTLAPAYFDDAELADRLNKFNPVRIGYDFIGWTYLYDLYEGAVNNPTILTKDNIETMYYLNNDVLTKVKWNDEITRPIFTDAGLVNSLGFAGRQEAFGDIEAMTSHTIYIFALWEAQTFTINIDLNIQAEQLENLYEKDSNFALALYNSSKPEGHKVVDYNGSTGVRTNYYKYDDNNYSEIVANLNFVVTFDGNFADAYCQIVDGLNTYTYNIEELFAVSTGYYLLGWMLNSTDPNTLFIANGLYSAFGTDGSVVNLDEEGTSNLISGYEVFNYTNYEKLYNSNYKNGLNSKEEGKYGTSKETFNNSNVNSIEDLDGAGRSSNFGYVTIGTEKYYITCEDVPVENAPTKHYLYFKYEGVKYYVVYYYLSPIDGGNFDSIQLVNDHEFLYYLVNTTKYKIRFDSDGHPYTLTDPNKYKDKIDFYETIRIAVYRYRTNTLSENYNCIKKHNTPVNHTSIGFEFDHDLATATNPKLLYFKAETTRQFTLYAHWKNKDNMYVDIDNMNNYLTNLEEGAPNPNSNPGLAGYYDVWNTYSHAVRDNSMKYDKSFIIENSSATSTSQDEEGIRLIYNYYDDLFINLNPYFNGRYLSEMTFTFYGIEETNYTAVTDKERSTFKLQTYRLVIKFAWDNVNHKIVIAQGGFNLYIGTDASAKPISTASSVSDGNQLIYNIFANSVPFTKMSLVDKYACETNVNNFFELFKYGSYYDRKDVNQVSFELKNVMTNIEIDCKYSIQTYQIDFYNIKHNAENSLYIKEGTTNEYVTPFTVDDIKPGSALLDENSFKSSTATTHQYLATISTDCAAGSPPGYNVPYGFYIYGVYYNSPYKPYRPIDEAGSIGIPTNVVELLRDPMYGFEYIYSHGYYNYGATSKQLKQADASDTYSAQCSGVLGATTVFNDSIGIRLSGLSFYAFGGWYEYYEDDDKIVFVGYNKVAESTYINRNISLYGYYYATNEPTNIQFYTWDKDNLNYVEYTGNTDQYTLNENTEKVNYMQVGGYMMLKEGQTNYVDNEGRVKVISYLQYGVDKTAFGSHNYTNNFIMENSNDENVLSMILDTYWYYEDSYNPLYFLDGGNNRKYIRYDKDTSQFYYLSNENDLNSSRVIVKIQTSDLTNFFLEATGPYNGKRLEFSKTDKLYTSHYGTEYNFSGTNLYAKVNKTGIGDRYYILNHIDDSYFNGSNPHYKAWMDSKQPKYYLDVEGSRYYMILKNTSGMSKASVFYDANGNEVTASESPVRSAILTTIKNYYVNYQGYLFKINYKQNHDDGGSTYINPFVNPQTNTTTITLLSGEEVECYFNYETRVLYEKLVVKTDSYTYYIKVNKANISDVDKYYKVMSVDPSYYDRFEDDTWAYINKPAYCVDIAGTRYYITSLSTGLGAADIAYDQVIYTAQGDNGGPLTGRTICRLNDYYVEYNGQKYFIEYKVFDGYVNPFIDATTNIVKVMIATNTYETCYFDYNTKTLYANVKASFDNKIYCAVNENYKINAVIKTDLWLIDNITIKLLPSPNIGFWYNGEQYGFVGYIEMNKDVFDGLVKKGDAGGGEGAGAGEIYLEFSNLITAVYTKDAFASGRFATTEMYNDFLNGRSFDEAYDDFVFNLREQVGTRISEYTMDDFLSDLLTAEEYKYVDGNTTAINYIKVNIPVTFENLIVDPRTGKQISLSVIAQHEFDIISTNTVVDTKISAIPIYSPFEMEFTETSYVSSGDNKSIQVDTSKMHVWHFEISSNSTYVYNKANGDYLNFVVLNLEQYAELKANSSNIADYLTHMMNVGKFVMKYSETSGSSLVNIKSDELGDGKFVVLSYYNKTGIIIEANKHVVRVSDNMLYLDIDSGVIDAELVRTDNFQP